MPQTKAVEYISGRMSELMRDLALSMKGTYGVNDDAILDVIGYPTPGFDGSHCNLRVVMVLDGEKRRLSRIDSEFVGIQVDVEYRVDDGTHSVTIGPNSTVITNPENPTEADLQEYLKSGGKPLYRIKL